MTNLPISGNFSITAIFGQTGSYWSNGHKGIDIVADNKTVYSTCDGTVRVSAFDKGGWGNYISIGDAQGRIHIFCHLADGSIKVKAGQKVTRATVLGTMGNTGNSTGVHLHYQINDKNGTPINPTDYLGIPNVKGTYNSKNYEITEAKAMTQFKDEKKISEWAKNAVKIVAEKGIMVGDDKGYFNPKKSVTREELAVVISKIFK